MFMKSKMALKMSCWQKHLCWVVKSADNVSDCIVSASRCTKFLKPKLSYQSTRSLSKLLSWRNFSSFLSWLSSFFPREIIDFCARWFLSKKHSPSSFTCLLPVNDDNNCVCKSNELPLKLQNQPADCLSQDNKEANNVNNIVGRSVGLGRRRD